jgi:hypothetical protein
VAAGRPRFVGRTKLQDASLLCGECADADRKQQTLRNLSDLEAAVEISTRRRIDMAAGTALAHGTRTGR